MSVDFVIKTIQFELNRRQTVFAREFAVVDVDTFVKVAELIYITSQQSRRDFRRRIDH